ncbi:hypothetical protein RHMOL_Rhmol05G0323300 [Rhododendron molle]|uniref:Uncharacterized protein n=1 Tax=Rhododendron molle TaxID=49168 RepID=A0ACC0NVF8_RHOML|nr:hypothetical protein RHMOL_Rhmol05G0323300 [Rhododendron molle]
MEPSLGNSDAYRVSSLSSSNSSRRYGMQLSASNFFHSPVTTLLEYSGILRTRSSHPESDSFLNRSPSFSFQDHGRNDPAVTTSNGGEVSIRIIGAGEQDHDRVGTVLPYSNAQNEVHVQPMGRTTSATSISAALEGHGDSRNDHGTEESVPQSLNGGGVDGGEAVDGGGGSIRDSPYQRYDIQQAARWIEQVLPFSLLLLVVFIRQHLQGFFVTIWIAAVMFKSNEILRKQTALKGERKIYVLIGISFVFLNHVIGLYWWYRNDDLLYPLIMLPPKAIPPFWHAIFIIMVNVFLLVMYRLVIILVGFVLDTLVRQAAMILKCILLMYFKNSRGRNYRKQGQLLTLVEYLLLLYRALLPAPVWYRFFLNKEYGSLFSSLMTGLYLTFKLTSVVEKVQSFFAALKALSRREIHYGAYATSEQVSAAGDLCAICQEKMHAPILLRCKHIFCEDCVSECFFVFVLDIMRTVLERTGTTCINMAQCSLLVVGFIYFDAIESCVSRFERERTCPLCRALVKPADLRSFGDGSTSLFFQLF